MKLAIIRSFIFTLLFLVANIAIATPNSKQIRESIISQARQISDVGAFELVVDARWGEVTLTGKVGSQRIADQITRLASSTEGVNTVKNELTIDPSMGRPNQQVMVAPAIQSLPTDSEISAKVREVLREAGGVNTEDLQLKTVDGRVTFSGTQNSFRDVDRILSMALMVEGVRDVHSEMSVGGKSYLEVAPR